MKNFFHSVTLDQDKCRGCINCMKRCPTEAIRVRDGKATIISERCIDCGECIRICPHGAKRAVSDDLSLLHRFKWTVAMPAPSFYGQFNHIDDINFILTGLKLIGFDDVFEVSRAAEIVTQLSRKTIEQLSRRLRGPVISSACTAVMRLIRVRFPELCGNVLPITEPIFLAAQMARKEAVEKTGLAPEEIGIFFISPCPAKVTSAKAPITVKTSNIDGVVSASEVFLKMQPVLKKVDVPENLMQSGIVGINWATSGGEAAGLLTDNYLSADGIENVIEVLEEIEDDKLNEIDFVELNACPGGCVGGVLNIANAFVASSRIKTLRKYLPLTQNKLGSGDNSHMFWDDKLEYKAIYKLDDDRDAAMHKMKQIENIAAELPGLDCGSCGAPSCRAFAEDIVRGVAQPGDCIIRFREHLSQLSGSGLDSCAIIPAPFRKQSEENEGENKKNDGQRD